MMLLPGFPVMLGSRKKLPQFVASAQGGARNSGFSVPIPSAAQVGDLMVFMAGGVSSGNTTIDLPAGFTDIYNNQAFGSGNPSGRAAWKFVTSGDKAAGSISVSLAAGGTYSGAAIVQIWRDCIQPGTGFGNNNTNAGNTSGSVFIADDGNALALASIQVTSTAGQPPVPTHPSGTDFDRSAIAIAANQTFNTRITSAYEHNLPAGSSGTREWSAGFRVYAIQIRGISE